MATTTDPARPPSSWRRRGASGAVRRWGSVVCLAACFGLTAARGSSSTSGSNPPSSSGTRAATTSLSTLLPAPIRSSKTLTFATSADYPPFESVAKNGSTIVGFDPDFGHAIGKALGVRVSFANASFDGLIPGLASGKYTAVMAGMQDKKDREKTVTFVDYMSSGSLLAVSKGNPHHISSFTDLCGSAVGVEKGTTQAAFAASQSKTCTNNGKQPIQVKVFNSENDANLALASGRISAVFAESAAQAYAVKRSAGQLQIVGPVYDKQHVGIAVPKGQDQLAKALQRATQQLIDNGTYKRLLAKWSLQAGAVPHAVVNQPLS